MKNNNIIITEDFFEGASRVKAVKDYGDEFDPLCGPDAFELTKEDIEALLEGKVLETNCNDEYGVLIRMKKAAKDE